MKDLFRQAGTLHFQMDNALEVARRRATSQSLIISQLSKARSFVPTSTLLLTVAPKAPASSLSSHRKMPAMQSNNSMATNGKAVTSRSEKIASLGHPLADSVAVGLGAGSELVVVSQVAVAALAAVVASGEALEVGVAMAVAVAATAVLLVATTRVLHRLLQTHSLIMQPLATSADQSSTSATYVLPYHFFYCR